MQETGPNHFEGPDGEVLTIMGIGGKDQCTLLVHREGVHSTVFGSSWCKVTRASDTLLCFDGATFRDRRPLVTPPREVAVVTGCVDRDIILPKRRPVDAPSAQPAE